MNRVTRRATREVPAVAVAALAVAMMLFAACATTPPPGNPVQMTELAAPPSDGAPFQPMGELLYSGGRSAGYDLYRVVGPRVNISYTKDGKWAGNLDGRDVWLTATPGKLKGAGVDLTLSSEGDKISIRGTWFQRRISLSMSPTALQGRAGVPAYDFTRTAPNLWSGPTPRGQAGLEARGDAQKFPDVPMPQFALALLAALP